MGLADPEREISAEELQLAARNHGMPLEALRDDLTPVGLHYLLIHYDIPAVDATRWRLEVDGLVGRPLELTLADLQSRPAVTLPVTMECAGNGRARLTPRPISQPWLSEAVGTAAWTGTPLRGVLDEAGLLDDAHDVVFRGMDRGVEGGIDQCYERALGVGDALGEDVLLVYAVNGQPLPPQHGAPLRLLVPGWYGMTSVKWLDRISVIAEPFDGYQQTHAYRFRQESDEAGTPVTRIVVRSLMVPPGVPDFLTRRRVLPAEPCVLMGRAWSGNGPITRVEVTDDGGATWKDARVEDPPSRYAWQRWTLAWEPRAVGDLELWSRATDASGATQPIDPGEIWNLGGYAVNAVQRVPVSVTGPAG